MTRKVFMNKLQKYLSNISTKEREDVEKFYNEMLDEENIGLDDEVPESFGDPKHIAYDIISNEMENEEENSSENGNKKKLDLRFLKILKGLPIFIPIVAVLSVVFSLFVVSFVFYILALPFIFLIHGTVNFTGFLFLFGILLILGTILWAINLVFKNGRKKKFKHKNKWRFDDMKVDIEINDMKNLKKDLKNLKYIFKDLKNFKVVDIKVKTTDDYYEGYVMDKMQNYSGEEIGRIVLDLDGSNIEITESDDNQIKIDATKCKKTKLETRIEKGCLYIETVFYENETNSELLVLEIPSELEFKGDISTGNVVISDLNFGDVFIEVNSGDVEIDDTNAEVLEISIMEGNLEINDVNSKNTRLSTDAGNIEVNDFNTGDFDVEVNAGNIEINDVKAVNCKIETNAGNVEIENLSAEKLSVESNSGNIELEDVNAVDCRLEASTGNVEFRNLVVEKLDIESSMGNVEGSIDSVTKIMAEASMGNVDLKINKGRMTYDCDCSMGSVDAKSSKYIRDKNNPDIFLEVSMGNITLR